MSLPSRITSHKIVCILKSDGGFLLVAALTLLTVLTLMGTTAHLLTRTQTKISGNFRNTQSVLWAAMAGADRAKEALRQENASSSDPASFNEELANGTRK